AAGPACDAGEDAELRSVESAFLADEHVEARTFRDIAVRIQKQRGFAAAVIGLEQTLDKVQPMIVLDMRIDRTWRNAHPVADRHMQAPLELFGIGDGTERNSERSEPIDRVAGITAE